MSFCLVTGTMGIITTCNTSCWRRRWHPTPVLLPGKSHGWTSLVGCSPWGREELDTPERLHFHFSLSCIGEGNGNPLQYSCLENPMDGRAWWAAVHRVAKSRTQLSDFTFTFFQKLLRQKEFKRKGKSRSTGGRNSSPND